MSVDIESKKKAFAVGLMARPGDAFKIAFDLFTDPADTGLAIEAATKWATDPAVIAHTELAKETPMEAGLLADKHQAAREVLLRARGCEDDEVFGKLMRLYAEMMGQIEKAGSNQPSVVINQNRVLIMPAPLNAEDWSLKATTQQKALSCGSS
jgi:hypothetical protein